MTSLRRILAARDGASASEFALVLPLLILLLLGMIDIGRFMWEYNMAEKATQMGVRYAIVTEMVPAGLEAYSFATGDNILAGEPVPTTNFSAATCTSTAPCSCIGGAVCGSIGYDAAAFAGIVARMQAMYPRIGSANVQVRYRNVGLGYAGDPNGPDVAPLVTVSLTGLTFQPITTLLFGAPTLPMPDFRSSLTAEDSTGAQSN